MNFQRGVQARMGACCSSCAHGGTCGGGMGATAPFPPPSSPTDVKYMTPHYQQTMTPTGTCNSMALMAAGIGAVVGLVTGGLAGLAAGGEGRRLKGMGYGALVGVPLVAVYAGVATKVTCPA